MNIDDQIHVNYIPTVGDFEATDDGIATIGGGLSPNETPAQNQVPPKNEKVNEIIANRGEIGGWIIRRNGLYGWEVSIGSNGVIDLNSGNIYIDGPNSLIRLGPLTGDYITLDGANQRMRSSNYSAGVAGFNIEPGLVEAQNIRARGVLQSAVFQKDIVSAIGGMLMVSNADALDADMTALDASTLTIKGDTTFSANDILRIKDGTDDEWLRVTNAASAPTYTVTRDLGAAYGADSNPVWKKGQAVVKQGISDGGSTYSGGWLQLFGEGTNSPYYSVFKRTGVAYNAITEIIRLGNLNGIGGFSADTFGIFIGSVTNKKFLSYDEQSGFLKVDAPIIRSFTAGENIAQSEAVYVNRLNTHSIDLESGSSQYLFIADVGQTGLDFSTTFSLEAWLKPESLAADAVIMGKYLENGDERSYEFRAMSDGKLYLIVSDNGQTGDGNRKAWVTDAGHLAVGAVTHCAVTFDISTETALFYVNGALVASGITAGTDLGANINDSAAEFRIGSSRDAGPSNVRFFDGLIDDARAWSDVRTGTEISANYQSELAGTEVGLVGYWKFNDDPTDSQSSGNNDLTLAAAPAYSTVVAFSGTITVKKADASAAGTVDTFMGFAAEAISDTAAGDIIVKGIVGNLSNIIAGDKYYISDTSGAVTNDVAAATVVRMVGIGVSDTEILIRTDAFLAYS